MEHYFSKRKSPKPGKTNKGWLINSLMQLMCVAFVSLVKPFLYVLIPYVSPVNSSVTGVTDLSPFLTIPHTYTAPGIYHARLHVYNDLSSVSNVTKVAVLQPITNLTIRLYHHSKLAKYRQPIRPAI